ncbi:MAG TPA: hypothetical protein VKA15_05115 [Isosphaeraceae bacterium]|nr:hypothetical protein [Isosphaeraceae bacterium]
MRFIRIISVWMALAATTGACRPDAKDGGWITFLSHRTGGSVLYRMHPDGSGLQAVFGGELRDAPGLPEGMTWYRQPHWSRQSPDGAYFLSWAIDLGLPIKRYHMPPRFLLHLGRLDGGPTRLITPEAMRYSPGHPTPNGLSICDLCSVIRQPSIIPCPRERS